MKASRDCLVVNDFKLPYRNEVVKRVQLRVPRGMIRVDDSWYLRLQRGGKLLINKFVADGNLPVGDSFERATRIYVDLISKLSLPEQTVQRPRLRSGFVTGMEGVNMSWLRGSRGDSEWYTLTVSVQYRLKPETRLIRRTFSAGSLNTVTQERIDTALASAYAIREHYEKILYGELEPMWLSLDELIQANSHNCYPAIKLKDVMDKAP